MPRVSWETSLYEQMKVIGRLNLEPAYQTKRLIDSNYWIWNRFAKPDGFFGSNYF